MVLLGFCLMYLILFFDFTSRYVGGWGGLVFIFTFFFLNKKIWRRREDNNEKMKRKK